ncbi:MAG TPA: septal ring lytic transglycosylase RlpA family protein [Gammaproteobacteria bacterium]|nr:septal ring lytic transglycosylase RlpA family protein [Xanthomonadales bacterium]MCB1594716.1 septal ring lytic transglycosylase RlpA family protein [Xanthomonadales bacterium]HOP21634.1 septal ring lytic transglycosylase RlpA family protein [Gammaproteobacteria bacterium]HPI94584.1 septal ring lytic transglycosylase RlpA family protein [Gammaproteobacteria bacterium]HPQ86029.1 septal ring lytic transglycosylase RlpA family protein [Gammaproteobacteria bacterium]
MKKFYVILILALLTGCSEKKEVVKKTNHGRYSIKQDTAPSNQSLDISSLQQWEIKPEPKSHYGNHSPYVVFGKTYHLEDASHEFEQTGTASWYGKKFHGHKTSNMEIFDMYKLTAAHRTLPLPSYVEVTNLDNNKKVVVRVNDRGPFKSKRIIDLSWAAAKALDYDTKGLANVRIKLLQSPEVQFANKPEKQPTRPEDKEYKYLQVGAFSDKTKALDIASDLSKLVLLPVYVSDTLAQNPLYRVRIGPLTEEENIIDIIQKVQNKGFFNTKMVVD